MAVLGRHCFRPLPTSNDQLAKDVKPPTTPANIRERRTVVSLCFYTVAIVIITSLYARRTIIRNPDWRDDSVLFLESLKVCSRSAKLQLQVCFSAPLNTANYSSQASHSSLCRWPSCALTLVITLAPDTTSRSRGPSTQNSATSDIKMHCECLHATKLLLS